MQDRPSFPSPSRVAPGARSRQRDRTRERVRAFIDAITAKTGDKIPTIADRSGVSRSTIYRWLEQEGSTNSTLDKLQQIADAYNLDNPFSSGVLQSAANALTVGGEGEALPYQGEMVSHALGILAPDQSFWKISSRALELAGYLPGDILKLDASLAPRPGDVVVAQIYDSRGDAETVIRIFSEPYLIARTLDPNLADNPILVRPRDVKIVGVAIASLRLRQE
jgi:transcriptional regulator with XRE-family HTH domain